MTSVASAGGGSCCPSDLDGDAVVGPADLAMVLGGWGPCGAPCSKTMVAGRVTFGDGTPAAHAVVVSSLGGQCVTGSGGSFGLEVNVDGAPTSIDVSVVATVNDVTFVGAASISAIEVDGITDAGRITVVPGATCPPAWLPGLAGGSFDGRVNAVAVFDDGSGNGPSLVIGGSFNSVGGVAAKNIAKWNGTSWSPLGSGLQSMANDIVVVPGRNGAADTLYVGGTFVYAGGFNGPAFLARWDGSTWSGLRGGVNGVVYDLVLHEEGNGTALYACGTFTTAGGASAPSVARWDGSAWTGFGAGPGLTPFCMAFHDDNTGGGPALFIGGSAGIPGHIAKWSGGAWLPLGSGIPGGNVLSLVSFDLAGDGHPALIAGGSFTSAGGQPAAGVAAWNGFAWAPLGAGLDSSVISMTVFDDGTGPSLVVAGAFQNAGGQPASGIARWRAGQWSAMGGNFNGFVRRVIPWDLGLGGGSVLYVGGEFTSGPSGQPYLARWGCTPTADGRRR